MCCNLNILLTILYTVIIFGVIIFIHELGHFIVAKLCKVEVKEFSLGMGPAILKHKGKETTYALRLLPIGGYVAMEGEDDESASENAFYKKSVLKRVLICGAGAFMNIILGFAIMGCTIIGSEYFGSTQIAKFKDDATSVNYGLKADDVIVKMNGTTIFTDRDIIFEAMRDDDGIIDVVVKRDGQKVTLKDVHFASNKVDGTSSINIDFYVKAVKPTFLNSISKAFFETVSLARNSWVSLGDLIVGRTGFDELSGPVGVSKAVGEAAKAGGISYVFQIAALITISVGMFNLLPFPALDGGRIVFLIIEAIIRRPINKKVEGYVNAAGLVLLLLLMLAVTCKDIISLF